MARFAAGLVIMSALLVAMPTAAAAETESPVKATHQSDRFGAVRELIGQRMDADLIPSVAISVAQQGEIIWEEGFGYADLANKTPATSHTVYRISSVSKVFTGTAIMVLVQRGKMELDRPINRYLGKSQLTARIGSVEQATVRRLANHTSGLPAYDQYFFEGEQYQKSPSDRMETLIARYGHLVWVPGERHQYSNLAMGVLSYAVSQQSGMSFADFMHEEVYVPLGMKRSFVGLSDPLRRVAAVPYFDGKPVPLVTNLTAGAGDLWSSAHDLIRFGMLHLKTPLPDQTAILDDESIDLLQRPTFERSGAGYGVGWGTDSNYRGTGYHALGHHGGNVGWHSFLLLVPSQKLAIAVLTNTSSHRFADDVSDAILDALIPDFEQRRLAAAAAKRKSQSERSAAANRSNQSSAPPKEFVGTWRGTLHTFEGTLDATLEVDRAGAAQAQIGEQRITDLTRLELSERTLTADLKSTILTADTRRQLPGILELDLTRRGDTLSGVIYANSLYGNPAWGGYRLAHWIELAKVR